MNCKLVKVKSKSTYTDKTGNVRNYINTYLVFENGQVLSIKPSFARDSRVLLFLAENYELPRQ